MLRFTAFLPAIFVILFSNFAVAEVLHDRVSQWAETALTDEQLSSDEFNLLVDLIAANPDLMILNPNATPIGLEADAASRDGRNSPSSRSKVMDEKFAFYQKNSKSPTRFSVQDIFYEARSIAAPRFRQVSLGGSVVEKAAGKHVQELRCGPGQNRYLVVFRLPEGTHVQVFARYSPPSSRGSCQTSRALVYRAFSSSGSFVNLDADSESVLLKELIRLNGEANLSSFALQASQIVDAQGALVPVRMEFSPEEEGPSGIYQMLQQAFSLQSGFITR